MVLPVAPIISIAMGLAKAVPAIVGFLKGPKAQANAEKVVGIARSLTGQNDAQAAIDAISADPQLILQLQAQLFEHEIALRDADSRDLETVNQTMRVEVVSNDAYNRRYRATFGYAMALSWLIQFSGLVFISGWSVINTPDKAGSIIASLGGMVSQSTVLWTIGLSVLGVAVYKRSQDKALAAGVEPRGVLDTISGMIKK